MLAKINLSFSVTNIKIQMTSLECSRIPPPLFISFGQK